MHDAIQWGTLILVGFGIMLSRYDFNTIRKEMREEIGVLRRETIDQIDKLRADLNRQTTAINALLFNHSERIAVIETKMEASSSGVTLG